MKIFPSVRLTCLLGAAVATLASTPPSAHSQRAAKEKEAKPPKWDSPLFHGEGPLAVTLISNLKALKKDKGDEAPWHTATISYADPGAPQGLRVSPVRVRTRGIWRLKNCDIPPIRLNFANKEVKGTVWHDLDEPKLVSICRDNDANEQYVLQELQLYRIFRLLTPVSHRARLLRMSYVDSASGKVETTRYAFITEDPTSLAETADGKILKTKGAGPDDLDPIPTTVGYVFQYLIGNTDFSIYGLHNSEIVAQASGRNLAIAYDFDFSGAVNASYATPDPSLPIKKVRERLYRGYCAQNTHIDSVLTIFQAQKAAIYALYSDSVGALMSPRAVQDTKEYFDEFYATISDPKAVERRLIKDCRKVQ